MAFARLFLLLCGISLSSQLYAQCETTDTPKIRLGMSTALSGPVQYIGQSMRDGMLAYFERVNCAANQHHYELIVRDDGYQPGSALENVKKLVEQDQVLAVVGNVGTPTAKVAAPYVQEQQKVFFGAYTGSSILRNTPPDPYIFNFRASYRQELEAIINHVVESGIKPSRIAFLIQDDAYGHTGFDAALSVLREKGFKHANKLLVARYPRNTLQIDKAIIQMLDMPKSPKAVIIVGAYAAAAKFINYSHNLFPGAHYYNLSFTGATALGENLEIASNRVFVSQVVPYLGNGLALSHAFKADMQKYVPSGRINEISFEGYIVASLLDKALQNKQVSSADDIKFALRDLGRVDIGLGEDVLLSNEQHQASRRVWLMQYKRGEGFVTKVGLSND
ncbi:MAG: ABC transporter substrate-binding protein [Alteromonadaceae bacterium]|nr:ABC transporter substrate-binding protein [Alteromonadaceae bacterium]